MGKYTGANNMPEYTAVRQLTIISVNLLRLTGTGILSPNPEENPYWWNANMV